MNRIRFLSCLRIHPHLMQLTPHLILTPLLTPIHTLPPNINHTPPHNTSPTPLPPITPALDTHHIPHSINNSISNNTASNNHTCIINNRPIINSNNRWFMFSSLNNIPSLQHNITSQCIRSNSNIIISNNNMPCTNSIILVIIHNIHNIPSIHQLLNNIPNILNNHLAHNPNLPTNIHLANNLNNSLQPTLNLMLNRILNPINIQPSQINHNRVLNHQLPIVNQPHLIRNRERPILTPQGHPIPLERLINTRLEPLAPPTLGIQGTRYTRVRSTSKRYSTLRKA